MKIIIKTICFVIVIYSTFLNIALAQKSQNKFSQVYFFGDSLTDMGNYQNGVQHDDYYQNAPVTNFIDGKKIPGNETWAKFLANDLGLDAIPSNKGGNDYAVSGAKTIDVRIKQVCEGILNGDAQCQHSSVKLDSSALYVIWIGANDLRSATPDNIKQVIIAGLTNITAILYQLSEHGAKHFLIISIPDISLTPLFTNCYHFPFTYCKVQNSMQKAVIAWNQIIQNFINNVSNSNIYYYRINPLFTNLANHPDEYGFKSDFSDLPNGVCSNDGNTSTKCKNNNLEWYYAYWQPIYGKKFADPDQFIFYNSIHPTTHTHKILADNIFEFMNK